MPSLQRLLEDLQEAGSIRRRYEPGKSGVTVDYKAAESGENVAIRSALGWQQRMGHVLKRPSVWTCAGLGIASLSHTLGWVPPVAPELIGPALPFVSLAASVTALGMTFHPVNASRIEDNTSEQKPLVLTRDQELSEFMRAQEKERQIAMNLLDYLRVPYEARLGKDVVELARAEAAEKPSADGHRATSQTSPVNVPPPVTSTFDQMSRHRSDNAGDVLSL